MKYAVIIPAKNEENNIGKVLQCVCNQTLKPVVCLVMDDGSEDKTPEIVREEGRSHVFVRYHRMENTGKYELGSHIVKIFEKGVKIVLDTFPDVDYIVKLDADLTFDNELFEKMALSIQRHDHVGIVSPQRVVDIGGKTVFHVTPEWHTNGDFKIYNTSFLKQAVEIPKGLGWDCADNVLAMSLGYKTYVDRNITFILNRPIGRFSVLRGNFRQGLGAWSLNYSLGYLLLKGLHDLFRKPRIIGSFYYWGGYLSGLFHRNPHILNNELTRLLRKLFWQSFFKRLSNKDFLLFKPSH